MALTFTDRFGREHNLALDVETVDRIKASTDIDLLGKPKDVAAAYNKVMEDVRILLNVAWHIIKPQAEKCGITIESFRESINGDVIEAMAGAFTEAIANFSPTHLRKVILAAWGKQQELNESAAAGATAAFSKADLTKVSAAAEATATAALTGAIDRLEKLSTSAQDS